jgi:hypothetical protein
MPTQPPTLSPEMKATIQQDEAALYKLSLWDCMSEDGDIVEVLVDGQHFLTVTLRHATTTVLVPIPHHRPTAIAIRGIHDGGGGITTGIRSSGGDYVLRSLHEGEVISLSVAADAGTNP